MPGFKTKPVSALPAGLTVVHVSAREFAALVEADVDCTVYYTYLPDRAPCFAYADEETSAAARTLVASRDPPWTDVAVQLLLDARAAKVQHDAYMRDLVRKEWL